MPTTNMSSTDWRYSDFKMSLRQNTLLALMKKFGHPLDGGKPKYSTQSIYECAHDWVSQGHQHPAGVCDYFQKYYT
jgi:hypothetical protein